MKKLAVIGMVFPEPNSTAAGTRMLQLLEFFKENHFEITFLSAAEISEFSYNLEKLDIKFSKIAVNDTGFEGFLNNLDPDFVLFDRFATEEQFGWKVSEICPNAVKILDTEDLHFLRKAREKAFKQNKNLEFEDLITDIFKREMASILRCDLSLIISEFEFDLLTNQFKIDKKLLFYLPIFAENRLPKNSFDKRKNLVSIGNFLHEPNWQTVLKIKSLWPKISKKIPGAEMHIYGAYASEKVQQLHNPNEKFLIKGRADSVENLFEDYTILLAPIPFGAGIKGKLLDSMRFGLPNITTSSGSEAMHGNLPWNGFICDNEEHFIEKTVLLYSDQEIWENAQNNGFEIVRKRFSKIDFLPKFLDQIFEIQNNLKAWRTENFLGQILQHNSLQSTKYLGKWIEEKNRHHDSSLTDNFKNEF